MLNFRNKNLLEANLTQVKYTLQVFVMQLGNDNMTVIDHSRSAPRNKVTGSRLIRKGVVPPSITIVFISNQLRDATSKL